jgi:two-component system chemotaxis response regulator CheY
MAHLLLLEDDPATQQFFRRTLAAWDWQLSVAATVAEGLHLLDDGLEPDCLALDLMLTDGGGEDVLKAVRRRNLKTRVAVITGVDDRARLSEVAFLRPDAVLQKPFDMRDVVVVFEVCQREGRG